MLHVRFGPSTRCVGSFVSVNDPGRSSIEMTFL